MTPVDLFFWGGTITLHENNDFEPKHWMVWKMMVLFKGGANLSFPGVSFLAEYRRNMAKGNCQTVGKEL